MAHCGGALFNDKNQTVAMLFKVCIQIQAKKKKLIPSTPSSIAYADHALDPRLHRKKI